MRYFGDRDAANWWFRPIGYLPKRVVLDANVILDSVLMTDSVGHLSLQVLRSKGYAFFSSQTAVEEAKARLRKAKPHVDLAPLIDAFCRGVGIEMMTCNREIPEVKDHDRHVAAATADVDGFLISEDVGLIGQMDAAQLHARTLREVALSLGHPDPPRQDLWVFGSGLGADGYFESMVRSYIECRTICAPDGTWLETIDCRRCTNGFEPEACKLADRCTDLSRLPL